MGGQESCDPDHLSRDNCNLLTNTGLWSAPLQLMPPAVSSACQGPRQTSLKGTHHSAPASHPTATLGFPPYLRTTFTSLCTLFPPFKITSQTAPSLPTPKPTFRQSSPQKICVQQEFSRHQSIHTCSQFPAEPPRDV